MAALLLPWVRSPLMVLLLLLLVLQLCTFSCTQAWMVGNGRSPSLAASRMQICRTWMAPKAPFESVKVKLNEDMKEAMKAKDKVRLAAIRAVVAAIKQKEVDDRVELTNEAILGVISKLVKQRCESIQSYAVGGRDDLVASEQAECDVIQSYLPEQLDDAALEDLVRSTITNLGASSLKDMGKVMNELRPKLVGQAGMSKLGDLIKKMLTAK